jgi:hypothetical protein
MSVYKYLILLMEWTHQTYVAYSMDTSSLWFLTEWNHQTYIVYSIVTSNVRFLQDDDMNTFIDTKGDTRISTDNAMTKKEENNQWSTKH